VAETVLLFSATLGGGTSACVKSRKSVRDFHPLMNVIPSPPTMNPSLNNPSSESPFVTPIVT
jgi:hypothetical protein